MTIAITPPIVGRQAPRREAAQREASPARVGPRVEIGVVIDDDAQMMNAVKKGFLIGTPIVFAITAGMALIAGTTIGIAAAIGGWSGLCGGWYFGGMFFINGKPRSAHIQNSSIVE